MPGPGAEHFKDLGGAGHCDMVGAFLCAGTGQWEDPQFEITTGSNLEILAKSLLESAILYASSARRGRKNGAKRPGALQQQHPIHYGSCATCQSSSLEEARQVGVWTRAGKKVNQCRSELANKCL